MGYLMDKGNLHGLMVIIMKETLNMVKEMGKERKIIRKK